MMRCDDGVAALSLLLVFIWLCPRLSNPGESLMAITLTLAISVARRPASARRCLGDELSA